MKPDQLVELLEVLVTASQGDFLDPHAGLVEQPAGEFHAALSPAGANGRAGGVFEETVGVVGREVELAGDGL